MIFVTQLLTIRWYTKLCNKDIKMKTKTSSFISWIISIRKTNKNIKTYIITKKKIKKN